jgi:hypothetical protein
MSDPASWGAGLPPCPKLGAHSGVAIRMIPDTEGGELRLVSPCVRIAGSVDCCELRTMGKTVGPCKCHNISVSYREPDPGGHGPPSVVHSRRTS